MNEIETGGKAWRKSRKREEKSVTLIKRGIFQLHALLFQARGEVVPRQSAATWEDGCVAGEFRLGTV